MPAAKRKAESTAASRKKSPLAGLPQNHYAPPTANMSPEQLQAWRKEQRRERNRQSAAASRQQTKARIAELEGEVLKYKSQYEEMKAKMEGMERQIKLLVELNSSAAKSSGGDVTPCPCVEVVTPPASFPNSPSRSFQDQEEEPSPQDISHSNISFGALDALSVSNLFSSECAPDRISSQFDSRGVASFVSKEHLIPINGQAVKTGATLDEVENTPQSVNMAEVTSVPSQKDGLNLTGEGVENFDVQGALECEEEVLDFLAEALEGDGFDPNLTI